MECFGYGPEHLRADIATGAEAARQAEAMEFVRRQRASGEAPVQEKHLAAASDATSGPKVAQPA